MNSNSQQFNTIPDAVGRFAANETVLLVGEMPDLECYFCVAATSFTGSHLTRLNRERESKLLVAMDHLRLDELGMNLADQSGITGLRRPSFVETVDLCGLDSSSTAYSYSATVRALADPNYSSVDFSTPGSVQPVRATEGGILRRAGFPEAAVDLAQLAGMSPIAVLSQMVTPAAKNLSIEEVFAVARNEKMAVVRLAHLIEHRRCGEKLVRLMVVTTLPTEYGEFRAYAFRDLTTREDHMAVVMGDIIGDPPLVRVHDECLTGDAFGSLRCDCGPQLQASLEMVASAGRGVVLYMRQEGRGIGLANKLRAYGLQDRGLDTVEANVELGFRPDERDYGIGAQILTELGLSRIRLITNNPRKRSEIAGYGLEIVEQVPLVIRPGKYNARYLSTKEEKMGHVFPTDESRQATS